MIRKGLKLFRQFLSIGLSNYILHLNYTLALLKSQIPTDLNQTVTLLSLSPEELPRKVEFKNVHKYISLAIFTGKWFLEKGQDLFSRPVLQCLEWKPCNYLWVLGFCACIVQPRLRLEIYSHTQNMATTNLQIHENHSSHTDANRKRRVYKLVHQRTHIVPVITMVSEKFHGFLSFVLL